MAYTADQIQSNRDAASASVRASLGLGTDRTAWTYEQRLAYNQALASYIATHPDLFTAQDMTNAEYVQKNPGTALEDASFDLGAFVTETAKPATDALQSVGSGVLSVANASKWALPLVAALAVVILLFAFARRTGARA